MKWFHDFEEFNWFKCIKRNNTAGDPHTICFFTFILSCLFTNSTVCSIPLEAKFYYLMPDINAIKQFVLWYTSLLWLTACAKNTISYNGSVVTNKVFTKPWFSKLPVQIIIHSLPDSRRISHRYVYVVIKQYEIIYSTFYRPINCFLITVHLGRGYGPRLPSRSALVSF